MSFTRITGPGISSYPVISGIITALNFKTGTTNVHSVGVEAAGINVLGGDTPIGTGSTIWKDGGALFSGIVTATSFVGNITGNVTGTATQLATNTTGVNLTLTGNLGVGGTITYEDVARVDATGISTFREGFGVGPLTGIALTAYSDGSIRTSGIVTATTFSGALTGNVTGTASNASGATGDFSIADKIVHTGDTNTAIRFPAADTITAETGGTERLRIDSNGDILINSPAEAAGRIGIKGTNSSGSTCYSAANSGKALEGIDLNCTTVGDGNYGGGISFGCGGNGRSAIAAVQYGSDDDKNGLAFFTHSSVNGADNTVERLRIDGNGKIVVAAGQLHPTRTLASFGIDCQGMDIYDGVGVVANYGMAFYNDPTTNKANGIGFFNDDGQTCGGYIVHQDKGSGNLGDIVMATSATSNTPVERLRIASVGDIAIGGCAVNTFSNYQTLTIGGARAVDGVGIDLERSDGNIYGRFFADANGIQLQTARSGDHFRFETHNGSSVGERVRISEWGWFKARGNAASANISDGDSYHEIRSDKPHNVTLAMQHDSSNGYGIIARFNHGKSTHYAYRVHNYASGSDNMFIRTDGDCENINNSYGSTSDVKLKENIVDAKSQWNDLKALKVRNFNYKADEGKTKLLGLVAQEAEEVCPSLVKSQPDIGPDNEDLGTETKYLKYSILYMKAIKALQESMERIETLEAKVASLEGS